MNRHLFLLLCLIFSIKTKNAYDYLLEWGKNNSLYISDKLGMRYINENNKTYYALDDIPKDTLIMTIPFKIILNLKKALELLNNKKINKLYAEYKNKSEDVSIGFFTSTVDQTFLTYLIYLVNHRIKHFKKNKFYQYYHYFFDTFETDLDSFPIFFNKNQLQILQGSMTLLDMTLMKELFLEEIDKLEHTFNQKHIDLDEYLRFRTLIITKSLNNSQISVIPFMDMFSSVPIDNNIDFGINETNNDIKIFTVKKIKRDDIFYMKSSRFPNYKRFILFGETLEKMNDYIDSFHIPMTSIQLRHELNLNEKEFSFEETVDLAKKKFYKDALKTYKKLSTVKKGDSSDFSAYKLFLQNLEMIRDNYAPITASDIHRQFFKTKDIDNVKRVLDFEKKFIDEKINVVRNFIEKQIKSNKKKSENKKNSDL